MSGKRLFWMWSAVLLMMLFVTGAGIRAQEDNGDGGGSGVIIETNTTPGTILRLNPLMCRISGSQEELCERMSALMFPSLYAVDPVGKVPTLAAADNNALVSSVEDMGENVERLTLRDDLTWNDGTPITAYDVFYSYLLINVIRSATGEYSEITDNVIAARPTGDYEIDLAYHQIDCTLPYTVNFPVIPAHLFDPQFAETVMNYSGDETITDWIAGWWMQYPSNFFDVTTDSAEDYIPVVASGLFNLEGVHQQEAVRLLTADGQLAYVLADNTGRLDRVDAFLNGEANVLFNPPLESRDELLATPDVQVSQYPGLGGIYVSLNLADPREPLPAYDLEGEELDQGHHPVFGDVRVRRALQMGINVQEMIDGAYLRYGTPLAANQLPASWAFDETLAPVAYDPVVARTLLSEAGWRDTNSDGIRECVGCQYGEDGQRLRFTLLYESELSLVAQLFVDQLWAIGVEVDPQGMNSRNELGAQSYDAAMFIQRESFPVNPDQTLLFTEAGDTFSPGQNTGSYHNPRVAELYEQARTLPGCDIGERAEIYHEIQRVLQEDQPYLWLFAPDEMVVASGGVLGFDPLPNAPFWNIRDWRVVK